MIEIDFEVTIKNSTYLFYRIDTVCFVNWTVLRDTHIHVQCSVWRAVAYRELLKEWQHESSR